MAIKMTMIGYLVYLTMLLYLGAFIAMTSRFRRLGHVFYALGFIVAVAAFAFRWYEVQHVPLQNLFEVFICLGMLVYPISLSCRRVLGIGLEAADALIGFIVLIPAGFVFSAEPQRLPPALQSALFLPHVSSYMLSYVILAKAAVQAFTGLSRERPQDSKLVPYEPATYRMVLFGFPLLTLGLVLGAWWGKIAWGDYWNWDPKELWSLVSWLIFVAYLHFRYTFGTKYPRANAAFVLTGLVAIIITVLWVNLAKIFSGLHSYA